MKYEQAKPLVEKLMTISTLYFGAPSLLREKIYNALDEFLPDTAIYNNIEAKLKENNDAVSI